MHFPPSDVLGSTDEASALVTLAWQEMFDRDTPDSYRPSLFDTHLLASELAELTTLAGRDRRWRRHVKLVQQEVQAAIATEHWLTGDRWCSGLLQRLTKSNSFSEINDLASVFSTTAPNPVPTLLEALHRNADQLPKNKRKTLATLTHLGTHAARRGYLEEDATAAVEDAICSDVHVVVDRIGASLQTQCRAFNCIVCLRGMRPTVQSLLGSSTSDVRLARQRDFPRNRTAQDFKACINHGEEVPLAMPIHAVTHGRAAEEALRKCRLVIAALNFYESRAVLQIDPVVLVSDARSSRLVDLRTEQAVAARRRPNATALARGTLATVSGRHEELDNALEQHSIALSSSDATTSLVGMWTALECLVGGSGTDGVIERIVRWIPPIVAARRVEKITRYLAVCCHYFYGRKSVRPSRQLARSSPYWMSPRDIFEAITKPKNNELILALLKDVGDHPLLRFRVYEAWEGMHDPKIVRRQVLLSEKRLAWHLERIYRARNMAVHMGRSPRYVSALIGHVQYYFSRCVSRVFSDLELHPRWSVSTSLDHQRQRFDFISDMLLTAPGDLPATLLFSSDDFEDFCPWQ